MTAKDLCKSLGAYRFNYAHETDLQQGIQKALETEHIEFTPEVVLSAHDRIDFMVGRVGIEVKVGHPLASVMRQIHRYAQSEKVDELLLITNRCRHLHLPESINGKPVEVLFLSWGCSLEDVRNNKTYRRWTAP